MGIVDDVFDFQVGLALDALQGFFQVLFAIKSTSDDAECGVVHQTTDLLLFMRLIN